MNFQQLEYFVTVAETGQITEAAQRLYITQPPMSRSIKRLEKELGVVLFIRTKKSLELTSAGKILYEKSKQLLTNYKEMLSALLETENGVRGKIRIGSGYPTIPLLSSKIAGFQGQYPFIEFHIVQEDPDELVDMLKKNQLDMVFSPHLVDDDSLEAIHLSPDPMVLVVNPFLDPAPEEDSVPIEKLEGIPFCMLRSGDFYGYNEILIAECQKHGFSPHILCQCNTAATAMILVAQGLGLSYQPKMIVDALTNQNLYGKSIRGFESSMMPAILLNRNFCVNEAVRIFLSQFQTSSSPLEDALQEVVEHGAAEDDSDWKRPFSSDADCS